MRIVDVGQHANGVIAIGQIATGVFAFGQVATGVIAIGQVARGVVAVGMGAIGLFAVGMGAVGVFGAIGMMAASARGFGLAFVPLVPRLAGGAGASSYRSPVWWALSLGQLALLAGAVVAFWYVVGIPLGDALLGPGGILR